KSSVQVREIRCQPATGATERHQRSIPQRPAAPPLALSGAEAEGMAILADANPAQRPAGDCLLKPSCAERPPARSLAVSAAQFQPASALSGATRTSSGPEMHRCSAMHI